MTQGVTEFERIWGKKQPYASKKKNGRRGIGGTKLQLTLNLNV